MYSKLLSLFAALTFLLAFGFNSSSLARDEKKAPGDVAFLDQFSEHHKDAIKMSELAESKASSQELKKMAAEMREKQKEEVDQMMSWRKQYYSSAPRTPLSMPKMDISPLREKSGKDFDLAFIDMMTKHHDQGIAMAKKATDKLFQPKIMQFAENSIHDQDRERQRLSQIKNQEEKSSSSGTTESR